MGGIEMIKEIDPKEPIQFAWNAFVDEMGDRKWGATDAFKWAWKEARKQEREECAKRLEAVGCQHCAENIRQKGQE